ncbi:MAG: DUF2628 domain-containing protein [Xanthobacteraceae bacterium]|nr:DUF2628 domain-containing protein [Xanthobacteraceae bacterium]
MIQVRTSDVATYLVLEPADGAHTQANAERVVFLREKFSGWAFVFTPFWLLRYRLWLAFLLWLAAFAAISVLGAWLGFGPYAALAASFFPSLVLGFEAVNLRARKLVKKDYREAGVVIAEDLETAERRFFESWKNAPVKGDYPYAPEAAPPAYPETKFAVASAEQNIIGMFPAPGQR